MKNPDETKKVLEHCADTGMACHMCGYEIRCLKVVRGKPIMQDALALIQQMEADNAEKDKRIAELEKEMATVKRERDAAVAIIGEDRFCCDCKHSDVGKEDEPCRACPNDETSSKGRWEWRGVCQENTEVRE